MRMMGNSNELRMLMNFHRQLKITYGPSHRKLALAQYPFAESGSAAFLMQLWPLGQVTLLLLHRKL